MINDYPTDRPFSALFPGRGWLIVISVSAYYEYAEPTAITWHGAPSIWYRNLDAKDFTDWKELPKPMTYEQYLNSEYVNNA